MLNAHKNASGNRSISNDTQPFLTVFFSIDTARTIYAIFFLTADCPLLLKFSYLLTYLLTY